MPNVGQYRDRLTAVLHNYLGPQVGPVRIREIAEVVRTTPNYIEDLKKTYGLSSIEVYESVFRVGLGKKVGRDDSGFYGDDGELDGIEILPLYDEERNVIVCPRGIFVFYEDVFYRRGRDGVQLLAASYHFQTAYQIGPHPLYARFEFDPLSVAPQDAAANPRDFDAKPVFHYHFSNYDLFHKHCHFPAGYFTVPYAYPSQDRDVEEHFRPRDAPGLATFLELLKNTELIPSRR